MIEAISSALTGIRAATQKLNTSASNIARAGVSASNSLNNTADAVTGGPPQNQVILPDFDLATEAINLNLAEIAYKANLLTLDTAGEQTDALLDILDTDN